MSTQDRLVLDTNVLVSALLNPRGSPGRIWDMVLIGEVRLAYNDHLLLEYSGVLGRPKIGFDPKDVAAVLGTFVFQDSVSTKPWPHTLPDPDDRYFLEVASDASATLISGNLRHFPESLRDGVVVQEPHEWLNMRQGGL